MNAIRAKLWTLPATAFHSVIAACALAGMTAAWIAPHLGAAPHLRPLTLHAVDLITAAPLAIEIFWQIAKGNLGVDILAFLSIVSAFLLRQADRRLQPVRRPSFIRTAVLRVDLASLRAVKQKG